MSASNFNLENLDYVIDHNKFQQTGSNDEIMKLDNLRENGSASVGRQLRLMVMILRS